MEESIHYLMMSNHQMVKQQLFRSLRDTNLTLGQPKVLDYLIGHDGAVQREIASACHIAPPSLTSVLTRMEQKGLVTRSAPDDNRRSLRVFLTDHGREMAKRVVDTFAVIEAHAMADFTPQERHQLQVLLLRLRHAMLATE